LYTIYGKVSFLVTFSDRPLTSVSRSRSYYRPRWPRYIVCAAVARSVSDS